MARRHKMDYRVHFMHDECKAFGCGDRGVAVLKIGRKWVTLLEVGSGIKARMLKSVWGTLRKRVVKRGKVTDEYVF